MTPTLAVRCPAKINLSLRVLGLRPDGYHELDTVFQTIDLWDVLEARPSVTLTLRCDDPVLDDDVSSNLVLRAAELLLERVAGRRLGAALYLRKSIPLQAGLGGGSSDAAGALLLCSCHWDLQVTIEELSELGAELGADVPFFLVGGRARGRGRGDSITALPFPGETSVLLGIPPFGLSTAEVYRRLDEWLTLPGDGVNLPRSFGHKWPQGNNLPLAGNDLEPVVLDDWPELGLFRDGLLEEGASLAQLSGSGSTVYGLFDCAGAADRARNALGARFERWKLVTTRMVSESVQRVSR